MKNLAVPFLVLFCAVFALSPSSLSAKEGGKRPCSADVEKFCKDVQPGGGAVLKCLKEHEAELSPSCKERGEQVKEKVKEARADCKADVEKFCKDLQPGGGAILKCLKEHEAELSEACKKHGKRGRMKRRGDAE